MARSARDDQARRRGSDGRRGAPSCSSAGRGRPRGARAGRRRCSSWPQPSGCRHGISSCSRAAPTSTRRPCAGPGSRPRSRRASCSRIAKVRPGPWPCDGWQAPRLAGDRRQGRCVECRRHADAAPARARSAAAASQSPARRHSRSWQRRHPWIRAHASAHRRRRARDLSGSRGRVALLRGGKPSRARRPSDATGGRRRPHSPVAEPTAVRRDRVGAVESVDGRHRFALHPRVLRDGADAARPRRRALPMGPHLRHQRRRPAIDCLDLPVGVSERLALAGGRRGRSVDRLHRAARCGHRQYRRRLATPRGRRRPRQRRRPKSFRGGIAVRRPGAGARSLGGRRARANRRSDPSGIFRSAEHLRHARETTTRPPFGTCLEAQPRRPRSHGPWRRRAPGTGAIGA